MKQFTTTFVAIAISLSSFAQNSLGQALNKAKKENKLILVDCYFTGCIPCEQMDKEVFPNRLVSTKMEKDFVFIKANIFTEKIADTLKVQYVLNGFPTFLIINGDGRLINSTSGYKDPGELIDFLQNAQQLNADGQYLAGYSQQFNEKNYPDFYVTFAKTRKGIDEQILTLYADTLKDFRAKNAMLPFLVVANTNAKASNEILNNYSKYASLYGEEVLQPMLDRSLIKNLKNELPPAATESDFNNFLAKYRPLITPHRWKINLQTLGERYFLGMKKDTLAYLNFAIENPILYKYYFNSLYETMLKKGQFKDKTANMFCQWLQTIITPNGNIEAIKKAAEASKNANNAQAYKKFMQMAIDRAKKYEMPYQEMEESLKNSN